MVKALYLDIENSQMVVEYPTYTLYNIQHIHPKYIKHDWYITTVAWAWLNLDKGTIGKIHSTAVNDFSTYKKDFRDDRGVVATIHDIISQADIIIGHNSDSFDLKKLNYKFIKYGMKPIEHKDTVDTLKQARKISKASSNSLYHLAKEFGVPCKIDLPSGVMHKADFGCEKSLKKLIAYNKGDIRSGASLYFKLRPYMKGHVNLNMYKTTDNPVCGNCGSSKLTKNGLRPTMSGVKQKYVCSNCGATTALKMVKSK